MEQEIQQLKQKIGNMEKNQLTYPLDPTSQQILFGIFPKFNFKTNGGGISQIQIGRATLVSGTVTVTTTLASTDCEFLVTRRITGGTVGHLSIGTVTNGTSFVINSSSNTDTSTITWMLIKP